MIRRSLGDCLTGERSFVDWTVRQPRVFISAVTSELGQTRQLAANALHRLGYAAVWQAVFGTESGDVRQMLRRKIDGCRGLIHLVGRAYGAEPPEPDAEFGRISFTQYELLYARKKGKPTFVFFAEEGCPADRPLEQLAAVLQRALA